MNPQKGKATKSSSRMVWAIVMFGCLVLVGGTLWFFPSGIVGTLRASAVCFGISVVTVYVATRDLEFAKKHPTLMTVFLLGWSILLGIIGVTQQLPSCFAAGLVVVSFWALRKFFDHEEKVAAEYAFEE